MLEPDPSDLVHNGKYLATVSGCKFCHTPGDGRNQPIEARASAAARSSSALGGRVVSSNLTPHPTGLSQRSRENLVSLFRSFAAISKVAVPTRRGENTVMPWFGYAGMTIPASAPSTPTSARCRRWTASSRSIPAEKRARNFSDLTS